MNWLFTSERKSAPSAWDRTLLGWLFVVLLGLSAISAQAQTFTTTGSLAAARNHHTVTLLSNGKVLIAGGYGDNVSLSSAELYDPATGAFSATGSLATARYLHTATPLSNGKVLLTGGYGNSGYLSSAELYDPATGTFSATGSLSTARYLHRMTSLSNGKVLLTGGFGSNGLLASAELYDPVTGAFSATGNLVAAREVHAATLLSNGKVLIAGGYGSGGLLASAELYDPATGTFTTTGSLVAARYYHSATLLSNGKVLIAGGYGSSSYLSSAELYDPATGAFSATTSLSTARYLHTATPLSNGKVLLAGGYGSGGLLSSAELYDPSTVTFTTTGGLATAREIHTATLLSNGQVLISGGLSNSGYLSSAELYGSAITLSIGDAVISEYRLSGPGSGTNGARDEFIELLNVTNSPLDLAGWSVGAGGVTIPIPSGKTIPAKGHLLLTNSGGYTLANYGGTDAAKGDILYTGDIALGSTLTLRNASGTTVDEVTSVGLTPTTATSQYSYARRLDMNTGLASSIPSDFNLVDVGATTFGPDSVGDTSNGKVRLGSPGPENLSSPLNRSVLYTNLSQDASQNTVRNASDTSVAPLGTLSLRRTVTNNTGSTLTKVRFRLINTTSGTPTGASASSLADVRVVDGTTSFVVGGVTVMPITVEKVAGASTGSLNSTFTIPLPQGGLTNGSSVSIDFKLGVFKAGSYRLAFLFEVLP